MSRVTRVRGINSRKGLADTIDYIPAGIPQLIQVTLLWNSLLSSDRTRNTLFSMSTGSGI